MTLDLYDVQTGKHKETELNIRDVYLYDNYYVVPKKEYRFQTIVKPYTVNGYEFIVGFGSDEEIDYNVEDVAEFFRFLNSFVALTMIENQYKDNDEITKVIKHAKEKLSVNNKWGYNINDLEFYAEAV